MNTFKTKIKLSLAVMAMFAAGGMAHANEHELLLSYAKLDFETKGEPDRDGNGVTLRGRGILDNGLRYDFTVTDVSLDDDSKDQTFGEIDMRYMFHEFIGVAGSYVGRNSGRNDGLGLKPNGGTDVFGLGLAAEYFVGRIEAYGTITSNLEEFGKDFALEIGGRYDVTPKTTLIAEFNDAKYNDTSESATAELAARYNMTDRLFVQGGFGSTLGSAETTEKVYNLGVGFNF